MAERRDEKRDEVLSYRREYAKEHREAINESHRKWRDKNRTTYNAYQRDWRASKHRKATVSSITARVNPDG